MRLILTLILTLLSLPVLAHETIDHVKKVERDWHYNDYYFDRNDSLGLRRNVDAWTFSKGYTHNAIVISCTTTEWKSGDKTFNLRFFLKSHHPMHKFNRMVPVFIEFPTKKRIRLNGKVSDNYVGNVFIPIPREIESELITNLKESTRFTVRVRAISGFDFEQTFSLMGFTIASLNTITNCQ